MTNLFFELIRIAIGSADSLSRTPSAKEWAKLYKMAAKQSLLGVCFAGIQKVLSSFPMKGEDPSVIGMPEMIYLTWMGMAAVIQQKNEVVNRQCVELLEKLKADGMRSCILKGQGMAALYGLHEDDNYDLSGLRQSGDIDIWVPDGMHNTIAWIRKNYGNVKYDYINAHVPVYSDTEVELHWRAQALTNIFANMRLQKWLEQDDVKEMMLNGKVVLADGKELVVPVPEFNAFYILLHCYHHMFESGLGLRQLMDYYFVLNNLELTQELNTNLLILLKKFGMMRFANGIMWILKSVFALEDKHLLCEPDEMEGRFLLNEIMQNGNFGHHDNRVKKVGSGKMSELWRNVQHNWHMASHYPAEMIWQPMWLMYHYFWKRFGKF